MMGDRLVMQESLFYRFRLDDHVPADHMLRAIDRFLDLDALRRLLLRSPSSCWILSSSRRNSTLGFVLR